MNKPEVFDPHQKGSFKEEFFPVKICTQRKFRNPEDPSRTFMYDVEETIPTLCVLESRKQTKVNYFPQKPETDTSTAHKKLGNRSFGNEFIEEKIFI